LGAPAAGVGRVHADHRDAAAAGHAGQPGTELSGRDASDGAAQLLSPLPTAQRFPTGGARVGEIKILDHDRRAVLLAGQGEQHADRRTDPPVAP
jgi:hypothetical protein